MKYFLLAPALLLTIAATAQSSHDFEDKVMELMSEDNYEEAIAECERAISGQRYGQTPYSMLAEVYLTSIPECPRAKIEEYYLAMLAMDVYKRGHRYLGKHDPEVFERICKFLPTAEWVFAQGLSNTDQVTVQCFDKTTPVYSKRECEAMRQR